MTYSIVLIPQQEDNLQIRQQAKLLLGELYSDFVPHITLVQFDDGSGLAKFDSLSEYWDPDNMLEAAGVTLVPSHDKRTVWVEIAILKSLSLTSLQSLLVDEYRLSPLNAIGDRYRPHITLGHIDCQDLNRLQFDLSIDVLRLNLRECKLHLVQTSVNYSIKEVLA